MKLPYVIDNQTHRLADVLRKLLGEHHGRSLDAATARFPAGEWNGRRSPRRI